LALGRFAKLELGRTGTMSMSVVVILDACHNAK
jgi:hypothetical protein